MAIDLRTTQDYLNAKAGTVGLTKQKCLQILAGAGAVGMTAQDSALNYAGSNGRGTIQDALRIKGGASCASTEITTQEASRRI